ncbi:DUF397 domain-containing protein [Actinokineospora sp.]|uniref:DUF397 domain-containing protein n=1 Tax=Actinokineospora sp. TaxID=1872133 RepID=UPI003D6AB281
MERWRKSTASQVDSACVEVEGSLRAVRDSKCRNPQLTVDVPRLVAWVCDERRVGPREVTFQ